MAAISTWVSDANLDPLVVCVFLELEAVVEAELVEVFFVCLG